MKLVRSEEPHDYRMMVVASSILVRACQDDAVMEELVEAGS